MGKVTAFLEIDRQEQRYQPAADRVRHFREFTVPLPETEVQRQASRCMDCGIPFCHTGCPVNNQIPDWNDLVHEGDWEEAARNLHTTNNFPEFTGRVCPAPCEEACTLNLEDVPVTIKTIEQAIADRAFQEGWVVPEIAEEKTGKRIAIIGAGSAGMAAAQQLARVGHEVHVYEREPRAGGLLRYGIPDFKMEKHLIDRRVEQMEAEGVTFHYDHEVTHGNSDALIGGHDAVLVTVGAEAPRNPELPGQDLAGVHYAMPFLTQQNKRLSGDPIHDAPLVAQGKHVVVIGGGDTASDCIGTSFRQGAVQVTQLDIRPEPPAHEDKMTIWPYWPIKMRTSSSQAEGVEREFSAVTLGVVGEDGHVTGVQCARADEKRRPIEGSEFVIPAELVLMAIGFAGPKSEGLLDALGLEHGHRGVIKANTIDYRTSNPKIWAAGDVRRGQSLIVWAIREGRQAARAIDEALMGQTTLPR